MKPKKKNTFFTFIFSFVPGAAEMYMGFLKNGVSILIAFVIPFIVTGAIYSADYLAIISAIIYVFAFFHARNVATASDEEFAMIEDRYVWEEFSGSKTLNISKSVYRKWIAIVLIIVGASGIWSLLRDVLVRLIGDHNTVITVINNVPEIAFSILVIVAGVLLINGKKKDLLENDNNGTDTK